MLHEILKKRGTLEIAFPKPKVKVPDLFTPDFIKALANEAEMEGMLQQAQSVAETRAFDYIDENRRTENAQLDEIWQKGNQAGFAAAKNLLQRPYGNNGFIQGVLHGWRDAETFKNPHQLFDTSKYSATPIAVGKTGSELASNTEDTPENRLWRKSTMGGQSGRKQDLKSWDNATEAAFTQHENKNRLSLNLNKFMNSGDHVQGLEGYIQGGNSNNLISKTRVAKPQSQLTVLATAMGHNVDAPEKLPVEKITQRPEPSIPRMHRQVQEVASPEVTPAKKSKKKPTKKVLELPVVPFTQLDIKD